MSPYPPPAVLLTAAELLRRWIGLDVATMGHASLERAVRSRMEAAGDRDAGAFVRRLENDPAERDLLVEEIVVAESWFFRDAQVFEVVRRFASARTRLPERRPVRVLCAPCAAGEEPYSVAMALLDEGLPTSWFSIDALDVSRKALARATAATYPANAFRTGDQTFRDRWFRHEGSAELLHDTVRRSVTFAWGNILDDAFLADRAGYDVVFCRNLLIYLTADARAHVERVLDRLLAADGLLVVGAAEPAILRGPWTPAADHASFTLLRGTRARAASAPADGFRPLTPATAVGSAAPPRGRAPGLDAAPLPTAAANHPDVTASGVRRPGIPVATDVFREAERLANAGRQREALLLCQRHEREAGPTPDICFLMAMLHQSTGDLDRAEVRLMQTLSLDAGHEDALLALALAASRRGDATMAERYRRSAARAFARREGR